MSVLDLVIVIYIGISLIRGFARGFLVETAGIVAALVSVVLSPRVYFVLEPFFPEKWPGNWTQLISFILVFFVSLSIAGRLLRLLTKAIPAVPLGCMNTVAGGILGFARSVVVSGIVLTVLLKFPVGNIDRHISKSGLASKVLSSSKVIYPFLPEEFRTQLEKPELFRFPAP